MFGDTLKQEWGLSPSFRICDARNFEVDLIVQELEEKNWRESGRFDEDDFHGVKRMTSIDRGSGDIDRVYVSASDPAPHGLAKSEGVHAPRLQWLRGENRALVPMARPQGERYQHPSPPSASQVSEIRCRALLDAGDSETL